MKMVNGKGQDSNKRKSGYLENLSNPRYANGILAIFTQNTKIKIHSFWLEIDTNWDDCQVEDDWDGSQIKTKRNYVQFVCMPLTQYLSPTSLTLNYNCFIV